MAVRATLSVNDRVLDAGAIHRKREGAPLRFCCCTLFEKDYHYGVAALANSLHRGGFRGRLYAGYRGPLPFWGRGGTGSTGDVLDLGEGCEIAFVPVDTDSHFTNYKPWFMKEVLRRDPADGVLYFDPDIVVTCEWSFLANWVTAGVALCQDVNGDMPSSHPIRSNWKSLLAPYGFKLERQMERYMNGGFVGVHRAHASFLATWQQALEAEQHLGCDLTKSGLSDRSAPFSVFDQDALNVAAMEWPGPLSLVGPEGMGFQSGGGAYLLLHAIGPAKPWRKNFTGEALRGRRPSRADRAFFRSVDGPVRPYGPVALTLRRWDLGVGAALGRYLG